MERKRTVWYAFDLVFCRVGRFRMVFGPGLSLPSYALWLLLSTATLSRS